MCITPSWDSDQCHVLQERVTWVTGNLWFLSFPSMTRMMNFWVITFSSSKNQFPDEIRDAICWRCWWRNFWNDPTCLLFGCWQKTMVSVIQLSCNNWEIIFVDSDRRDEEKDFGESSFPKLTKKSCYLESVSLLSVFREWLLISFWW
jgi:hypothetical protein